MMYVCVLLIVQCFKMSKEFVKGNLHVTEKVYLKIRI